MPSVIQRPYAATHKTLDPHFENMLAARTLKGVMPVKGSDVSIFTEKAVEGSAEKKQNERTCTILSDLFQF